MAIYLQHPNNLNQITGSMKWSLSVNPLLKINSPFECNAQKGVWCNIFHFKIPPSISERPYAKQIASRHFSPQSSNSCTHVVCVIIQTGRG